MSSTLGEDYGSEKRLRQGKYCAFCKFWWGPACKYIQPHIQDQGRVVSMKEVQE